MSVEYEKFGQVALSCGFITGQQLSESLGSQRRRRIGSVGQILVEKGYITAPQARQVGQVQQLHAGMAVRVGHYELISLLGRGGMGEVYQARDTRAGAAHELVAVKLLPPCMAHDPEFRERFSREGQLAGALKHPNLVAGYEFGQVDGFHYLAMEYVPGNTTWNLLRRGGPLDETWIVRIGLDICAALDHAARHGLVHRDIKPENIIVTPDGRAKLLDLGLARTFDPANMNLRLTRKGATVGSPLYTSPEQARGEDIVDTRSDLYALGGTLYHLATGREPFPGDTAPVVMNSHLNEPVVWPADVNPELSVGLSRVLMRLLAKERRKRYQTPDLAAEDFERLQDGRPVAELPENADWYRRRDNTNRRRKRRKPLPGNSARRRWLGNLFGWLK
jgi:serine/threonine protein kinase